MADKVQQQQQQREEGQEGGVSEEDCEEMLLCARYGEVEEMKELLEKGVPITSTDGMGNTALHYAAANGLLDCARYLVKNKCPYLPNNSGNLPLHWAIQNKAVDVAKLLIKAYPNIDVLQTNAFGKSAVTEAFNCQDQHILKLVLEHPSAAALESEGGQQKQGKPRAKANKAAASKKTTKQNQPTQHASADASKPGDADAAQPSAAKRQHKEAQAEASQVLQSHTHHMQFSPDGPHVHVREIATDWFGKVFGDVAEDDTTGIQLWAASLIAARWVVDLAPRLVDKRVLELGAGCGLPGLAALAYTRASRVVLTDFFSHTVDNLRHNLGANSHIADISERGKVRAMDWNKRDTWPTDEATGEVEQFDVLLGCDLVYDTPLVPALASVVCSCLQPSGTFFYVSGGKRKGAKEFITELRRRGMKCDISPLKPEYKANPLVSGDDQELELHFNELYDNVQMLFEFTWPAHDASNNEQREGDDLSTRTARQEQ